MTLNKVGIGALIVCALVIGGLFVYLVKPSTTVGLTNEEINIRIADSVSQATVVKDTEIDRLKGLLTEQENETVTDSSKTDTMILEGYVIAELHLNSVFEDTFSDREISTLFDEKIDFDGDMYDAEETLKVKNISLEANGNDFEGNVYMTMLRGAVEYKFTFENDLNVSEINEDETLEFNFLGEKYIVSEWDVVDERIVLTKGEEYTLRLDNNQNSVVVDNKTITLKHVTDDAVYIDVDGVEKSIDEGHIRTVNGLQIKPKDVFASETYNVAVLLIGKQLEIELSDGDEYAEDSAWEYVIDAHSIGIVLIEDFTEVDIDDEEEFQAIGTGETFCLPNEYVCIKFNGITEDDVEEYRFELDMKSGNEYVRVNGNFISGIKDYERLYINNTGIYNRDLIELTEPVELADTDSILTADSDWITIDDFRVNLALNNSETMDITTTWNTLNSEDEDWLSEFGLLIVDPEDSAEDYEFNVFVPEQRLEGSISLI